MNIFFRSKHKKRSMKKSFLINFCKIHRKTLVPVFFFIKKETLTRVLPCRFCEISKKAFFTEFLQTAASDSFIETIWEHRTFTDFPV